MTIRRGFLNWGIFFICLGAVPLAVQLGGIDRTALGDLLRLWPLILIGIGLGMLLRLTPYASLGGVVVAGTFGLLIGVLFAGGAPGVAAACTDGPTPDGATLVRDGTVSATQMSFDVEVTCAEIDVARAPGGAWHVDVAAGDSNPRLEADGSRVSLHSGNDNGLGLFGGDARERWNVSLPSEPALAASVTVNAATARLSLGHGALSSVSATYNASDGRLDLSAAGMSSASDLSLTLNASSLDLILPSAPLNGGITLNAASLKICSAPTMALSISYSDTLSSNNFAAAGLVANGQNWQSAGYDSAGTRIDLHLSANVSSIDLDRSGGCQ